MNSTCVKPGRHDVVDELVGQLAVGQPLPPRAEVHLVDAHRPLVPAASPRAGQPRRRRPTRSVDSVTTEALSGRHLGGEGHRVGLLPPRAVGAEHVEPVPAADRDAGDEDLPHAGGAQRPHRVGAGLPVVEVAGHPHAAGVGRPHGERHAVDPAARGVVAPHVRAEHLPEPLVPALADQVLVELAERRQPAVGVVDGVAVCRPRRRCRRPRGGSRRAARAAAPRRRRRRAAAGRGTAHRPRRGP